MKSITVQNQLNLGFRPVSVEPRVGLLLTGKHFFIEIIYHKKANNTHLYYGNFAEALLARRAIGNGIIYPAQQDLTVEFCLLNKNYEFEVDKKKINDIKLSVDNGYRKSPNGSLYTNGSIYPLTNSHNLVMEVDNISHCQQSYSYCLFFDKMAVFLPYHHIPYIKDVITKTKPIFATDCQLGKFFIPKQSLTETVSYIERNLGGLTK